ncbi:hypothetical protein D3C80_1508000 [compost metagenome]
MRPDKELLLYIQSLLLCNVCPGKPLCRWIQNTGLALLAQAADDAFSQHFFRQGMTMSCQAPVLILAFEMIMKKGRITDDGIKSRLRPKILQCSLYHRYPF